MGASTQTSVCEVLCGKSSSSPISPKAFESDDGQSVLITDDDLASLPEERSREIEVLEFVAARRPRSGDV